MIQVEFSKAATSGTSLRVGVVLRYGENGPVRFAQIVIDDSVMDWHSLNAIMEWTASATSRWLDRERELEDEQPLPGM